MEIIRLKEATPKVLEEMNKLIVQLRRDGLTSQGSLEDLEKMVSDENAVVFVAKDVGKIIGSASLYIYVKLGKHCGTVEDVVVDDAYRGKGLGKLLMQAVIDAARSAGVGNLYLTSRPDPDRVAANKLYQKLGFEQRETNVYKLTLS
jgi:N-acetylglutamate synthase-like GNAT family acetyltransferase